MSRPPTFRSFVTTIPRGRCAMQTELRAAFPSLIGPASVLPTDLGASRVRIREGLSGHGLHSQRVSPDRTFSGNATTEEHRQ